MTPPLSDGYGDDLTVEEVLALHEPFVLVAAGRSAAPHAPFEDLAQEGRIHLWKAAKNRPGEALRGLATVAVGRRVKEVAHRETWTGHQRKPGEQHRPPRGSVTSLEGLLEEAGTLTVRELSEDDAGLDAATWGYHHGELMSALNELTPRQRRYVYRRFWLLDSQNEIAADEGRTKAQTQHEWQDHIRPVLSERLEHLVRA